MKLAISYFYQIRNFKPNMIPVSTARWDPKWYHDGKGAEYNFIDKNGWSDKCNLKNQDFALFMELRIIEYKRIYGSIS